MPSETAVRPAAGRGSTALPPLHFTLPVWEPTSSLRPRSRRQLIAGLAMYAVAVWLAFEDATFRHFEALIATPVTQLVTGRHGAVTSNDLVYFALGTHRAFGLQVTNECTSALLLIPLLVMMGSFTVFSRVPLRRELLALLTGAALMLAVNVLRICGIAWSTWRWGFDPGYKYSHVFVGSAFSLIGFVGAMLVALWTLVRTERKQAATVVVPPRRSVRNPEVLPALPTAVLRTLPSEGVRAAMRPSPTRTREQRWSTRPMPGPGLMRAERGGNSPSFGDVRGRHRRGRTTRAKEALTSLAGSARQISRR